MSTITKRTSTGEVFGLLYLANFILSFHLFFVLYTKSSFLSGFVEKSTMGLIWIAGSMLGILALTLAPSALRKFGNYKVLVYLSFVEMISFLLLALSKSTELILAAFVVHTIVYPLIIFNLDIFLESYTKKESTTGSIRGTFLTTTNSALIIAPLLAGFILTNGDYWKIYLLSAVLLVPFIFIISKFQSFKDPVYNNFKTIENLKYIWKNKNLYRIFMSQFILRFFFTWMVIYLPIYLHEYIGFSWTEFGIMTSIMLLPFVMLEIPAGKIADGWMGEKEMLSIGFLIMAVFTFVVPFLTTTSFFVWTAIMFLIRVGASLVEIMTESYFFKHVNGDDSNIIGFFRTIRPASYVAGPIVATIALYFLDIRYIFFVLVLVILYGLRYSLALKDTK